MASRIECPGCGAVICSCKDVCPYCGELLHPNPDPQKEKEKEIAGTS
jgi:hypothetical protein